MTADSRLKVGVIGDPVAHSISPAIHQPALDALGIRATYERWQTTLAELPGRIKSLRADDVLGANLTVPHKISALGFVDEVSPLALKAVAVNTIVNRGGVLFGDNTDVYGFATALHAACPDVAGKTALILGAGGAARGVVLALDQLGIRSITVANRDVERAKSVASDLVPIDLRSIELSHAVLSEEFPLTNLLINATSLGWHPGEMPVIPELLNLLPDEALVVDLTYRATDLLIAAGVRGLVTLDGLSMLVHQGARAFELFTGQPAPVDIMMQAALEAREDRT